MVVQVVNAQIWFLQKRGNKGNLHSPGKTEDDKKRFTLEVKGIARTSAHFLRREVGIGSRGKELEGHSLIREDISATDTH
jgi:hypothetical protein